MSSTSFIISIQYVIIICNDVTRASLNKDEQNLLTKHFLASPHVCDTIEGLILAYYDWLFDLTSVCIKLLSKLIYSRVIAVSLLGILKDFSYVYKIIARNVFVTKIKTYFKQN